MRITVKFLLSIGLSIFSFASQLVAQNTPTSVIDAEGEFEMTVLTAGLDAPWELAWGPDDYLWVTERTAGNIPDLTIANNSCPHRFLYAKIVRLRYDAALSNLSDPVEVIAGLLAGGGQNSGRLKIGPDNKLYYSIGQQLANAWISIEAQTLPTGEEIGNGDYIAYQGKSLRFDLERYVPDDNPTSDGVRSHIFTYGHRNMQGLDFAPDGMLYSVEHGPKADDEINILVPGENYGWPHISGFRDDMAYQNANWPEARNCKKLQFSDL